MLWIRAQAYAVVTQLLSYVVDFELCLAMGAQFTIPDKLHSKHTRGDASSVYWKDETTFLKHLRQFFREMAKVSSWKTT